MLNTEEYPKIHVPLLNCIACFLRGLLRESNETLLIRNNLALR